MNIITGLVGQSDTLVGTIPSNGSAFFACEDANDVVAVEIQPPGGGSALYTFFLSPATSTTYTNGFMGIGNEIHAYSLFGDAVLGVYVG